MERPPKKNHEVQANLIILQEDKKQVVAKEDELGKSKHTKAKASMQKSKIPPLPFSQNLKKAKEDACFKKLFDTSIKLNINFPLLNVLQGMPKYAKYLKDLVTNKAKLGDIMMVALTEECSSMVISKILKKFKDFGSLSLFIQIVESDMVHALSDLGACNNLITFLEFDTLGLGKSRPFSVVLQMADKTRMIPKEITEDVFIKVCNFIIPTNFIFLDHDANDKVQIILGRPFLAKGGTPIDAREGTLKMRLNDEKMVFRVYKALNAPSHYKYFCMIKPIEEDEYVVKECKLLITCLDSFMEFPKSTIKIEICKLKEKPEKESVK
ncbi:uncharacterized protein LOC124887742 [Capsicum annuum]|uniref:uncharacterized protein LOC124887742 n=1 Tax=Capsicum annuum TaxID=4072 RepID=UPI001FB04EFA|nr:uncharacterized protein LOC124887742 [Capsicum annuum]